MLFPKNSKGIFRDGAFLGQSRREVKADFRQSRKISGVFSRWCFFEPISKGSEGRFQSISKKRAPEGALLVSKYVSAQVA